MADVHEPEIRSYNMSRIKGKNTKPEILVRKALHGRGLRFRVHDKRLPGKPDLVFPKYKTCLFVHGCFWHQHEDCKYASVPKTRTDWWMDKLGKNVARDKNHMSQLHDLGWTPLIVWECEISPEKIDELFTQILKKR